MSQSVPASMQFQAVFHPQAWQNDYAIDVDPEGAVEFDVTPEVLAILAAGGSIPEDNDYESDELRHAATAPAWIQDWSGPFYIEVRDLRAAAEAV